MLERVRRGRSTVSDDRRLRCQRSVFVISHVRHADGVEYATTGRERVPARIGADARTDGGGMVDLGIRTHETRHTTSDQRSREENTQTFGGRVVHSNEHGVSVSILLLPWSPVHTTRGERRQRKTHGATARRGPKEHRLPTSLCQSRRTVGMQLERYEKRSVRENVYGCCISSATTRTVDDYVTTDPDRSACRNRFRIDRMRRSRTGSITCELCRDAARVQEHPSDARRCRSVHAPILRRTRHHGESAGHCRGLLSRQ